jgi:hypothetical protein
MSTVGEDAVVGWFMARKRLTRRVAWSSATLQDLRSEVRWVEILEDLHDSKVV